MAIPPKSRRSWAPYASAEDLCDPNECMDEAPTKPNRDLIGASAGRQPSSGRSPAGGYRPLYRSPRPAPVTEADTSDGHAPDSRPSGASSAPPRPRRHAVNLLEALEAEDGNPAPAASSRSKRTDQPTPDSPRSRSTDYRAPALSRSTSANDPIPSPASSGAPTYLPRTASHGPDAPARRSDQTSAAPDGSFSICAVHPAGEGDTVAVELCVPADFAEAVTGSDKTASARKNGLYTQKPSDRARWNHGGATVEPRSRARSIYGDSDILAEAETAIAPSYALPDAPKEAASQAHREPPMPSENAATPAHRTPAKEAAEAGGTRIRLYLLVEQYADLRPQVGAVTEKEAETLVAAGKLCSAVRRGMRLLGYGDRSSRRLAYQLKAKGVDGETAQAAADYLVEKGLIQEDNSACLRAAAGVRKLWGPRRIRDDLRASGYTPEAIEGAMASLAEVNFEANCLTLIRRKYRSQLASDAATGRDARQKLLAALLRLGYDTDTACSALRAALGD